MTTVRLFAWTSLAGLAVATHLALARALDPDPQSEPIFRHLWLVHDAPAAALLLATLPLALLLMRLLAGHQERLFSLIAWIGRHPWQLAALLLPLLGWSASAVYLRHPLAMDEYTMLWQAKVFAAGELWARVEPWLLEWLVPRPFVNHFIVVSHSQGVMVSAYWPGFALLLLPFVLLDLPWLLNPLLASLTLPLFAFCGRALGTDGRDADQLAGWSVILALASPQLTVNGISFYSMPAHLLLNLAFAALLLRPTAKRALLAGVVGSWALVLHQPIAHVLFASPWLAWLATRRERSRLLLSAAVGYLPLTLFLGLGWSLLLQLVLDPAPSAGAAGAPGSWAWLTNALGSGLALFAGPPSEVLAYRLVELEKLFLWSVPGLPLLALIGFLALRPGDAWPRLLAFSALTTLLGYSLLRFDQGHGWGHRYFHSAWMALPILGALALARLPTDRGRRGLLVLALASCSLLIATPLRFYQVRSFVARHLAQVAPLPAQGTHVRFVDWRTGYYRQDLVQNDPFLRGGQLTLVSHGRETDAALARLLSPVAHLVWSRGNDSIWRLDPPPERRVPGAAHRHPDR